MRRRSIERDRAAVPRSGLAVIACMDARLDVALALGLAPGDAHILRNAGGLVTDDVIRSLVVSQQVVGTDGILHHPAHELRPRGRRRAAIRAALAADLELGPQPATLELGSLRRRRRDAAVAAARTPAHRPAAAPRAGARDALRYRDRRADLID